MQIDETSPPEDSLIHRYTLAEAHYTDAFVTDAPEGADLVAFIAAFYTTPVFKAERFVLRLAGAASTDAEALALAQGTRESFAAWKVEGRSPDDILLMDKSGRTMSWLCVRHGKLWFGSVVVPVRHRGKLTLGPVFQTLLVAHKLYSRVLLSAAAGQLRRSENTQT